MLSDCECRVFPMWNLFLHHVILVMHTSPRGRPPCRISLGSALLRLARQVRLASTLVLPRWSKEPAVCLTSLRLSTLHSSQSLPSSTSSSGSSTSSSVWVSSEMNPPVLFREWGAWHYWPTTPLSQVMSPTSSTTATSQRPLKSSSRSPPATPGPRTCMTGKSVTTPSAERPLHHCSLRSEKIQRAVDKLTTFLKKVCSQVSRCLSVM